MDEVFGLTAEGIRRTAETNRRVLGELMPTGRRTRRVYPGGGGSSIGNEWIDFSVYEVCPILPTGAIQAVWAQVTRTSCQTSVEIGDIVLVYDPNNCWFNLPIELLSTLSGRADLTAGHDEVVLFCAEFRSLGECYWKVTGLCCYEESY